MDLPENNMEVPLAELKEICEAYGLSDLWEKGELMIDIARAGAPKMAEVMFAGVRVGGHEALEKSFSWGSGRPKDSR